MQLRELRHRGLQVARRDAQRERGVAAAGVGRRRGDVRAQHAAVLAPTTTRKTSLATWLTCWFGVVRLICADRICLLPGATGAEVAARCRGLARASGCRPVAETPARRRRRRAGGRRGVADVLVAMDAVRDRRVRPVALLGVLLVSGAAPRRDRPGSMSRRSRHRSTAPPRPRQPPPRARRQDRLRSGPTHPAGMGETGAAPPAQTAAQRARRGRGRSRRSATRARSRPAARRPSNRPLRHLVKRAH